MGLANEDRFMTPNELTRDDMWNAALEHAILACGAHREDFEDAIEAITKLRRLPEELYA